MRVIAGSAKGRRLQAPAGMDTRPITDRIKESLFNILTPDIEGADFLDLFAGSGSVGIEALSRGARQAVLVDNSRKAARVIAANVKKCDFQQHAEVRIDDVMSAIKKLEREGRQFDIIYVDPPFTNPAIFSEVMAVLDTADILSSQGKMMIRSHRKKDMPERLEQLERYRIKEYGESVLHFYRKI